MLNVGILFYANTEVEKETQVFNRQVSFEEHATSLEDWLFTQNMTHEMMITVFVRCEEANYKPFSATFKAYRGQVFNTQKSQFVRRITLKQDLSIIAPLRNLAFLFFPHKGRQ